MIRKFIVFVLLALAAAFAASGPAKAQQANLYCFSSTPPTWQPCNSANPLQTTASGGGSGGGGGGFGFSALFVPGLSYATITASASSGSVALPTGNAVAFQNTGTTAVSCTLGSGSATAVANENIIPPNSSLIFSVGTNTWGACIDQTGTASNVVVLTGGTSATVQTAGADAVSNTAAGIQEYTRPSWWNGATWDRAKGDATNGLAVNCLAGCAGAGTFLTPSATFTRPGDTTAYTVGDLVANNTASGSVTPLSWTINQSSAQPVSILRIRMSKSTTGVTAPNFRIHLYSTQPTVANGDNGAFSSTSVGYLGAMDCNMPTTDPFSDGGWCLAVPNNGTTINVVPTAQTVWGLVEARGAYAPGNAEVFTFVPEVLVP